MAALVGTRDPSYGAINQNDVLSSVDKPDVGKTSGIFNMFRFSAASRIALQLQYLPLPEAPSLLGH
jgi:hypothetical protein